MLIKHCYDIIRNISFDINIAVHISFSEVPTYIHNIIIYIVCAFSVSRNAQNYFEFV